MFKDLQGRRAWSSTHTQNPLLFSSQTGSCWSISIFQKFFMGNSYISVLCFTLKFFSELRSKIYFIYNFQIFYIWGAVNTPMVVAYKYIATNPLTIAGEINIRERSFLLTNFVLKTNFYNFLNETSFTGKKLPTKVEKTHAKSDRRQASMVWGMMLRKQTMEDWRRESIAERSLYPQI